MLKKMLVRSLRKQITKDKTEKYLFLNNSRTKKIFQLILLNFGAPLLFPFDFKFLIERK